jgi:very-long-chain enoyl-CoA reductase
LFCFKDMSEHGRAPNRAFVSYGSPIAIFLVFFVFSRRSPFQTLLLLMWLVHFAKRLLETRFVHLYSPGKQMHGCFSSNAFVFYIVFALWIGFSVFRDSYVVEGSSTLLVALFFLSIVGNFVHHYKLRLLKLDMDHTRKRTFPNGLLFELVACPHYTFECLTWLLFAVISNTFASWCFFFATVALLLRWSKERYLNYKQMKGYPEHRKALIPFLY